jgi:hypothetical protein
MATRKNAIICAIILAIYGMSPAFSTQAKQDSAFSKIVGLWVGQSNNEAQVKLPPGELTLKSENGKLTGTWILYASVSEDDGPAEQQRWELPLIDPKFDGKILSFKADLRLMGKVEIEFKLVGDDEAELRFVGKNVPGKVSKYKHARK